MSSECCDVIVVHSPPIFTGHRNAQPNLQTAVCIYNNIRLAVTQQQSSPVPVRRYVSSNSRGSSSASSSSTRSSSDSKSLQSVGQQNLQTAKPRRPCLVTRADSESSIGSSSSGSSSDENEPHSPIRRKKKVVFADDRGLSLTQVRLMNEPSNQPPKLMTVSQYLNQQPVVTVTNNWGTPNKHPAYQLWQLRFSQPASCYLDFRRRLDTSNISLENVIVKSPPDHRIVGTVKVRNLSYDKEVFIRCTEDNWSTHRDALCTYVQQNAAALNTNGSSSMALTPVQNIYDTFSFSMQLPTTAASVEFAVCYKCTEFECWDNNDGNNYCVSLCSTGPPAGPPLQKIQEQNSAPLLVTAAGCSSPVIEFDHHQKSPVHYFGAQSKQNSWTSWRDQPIDMTTYW